MISPSIRGAQICLATPLFYPSHGGSQLRYKRYKRYLPGLREPGADVRVFAGTATPLDFTPEDDDQRWSQVRLGRMLPVESLEGTPVHRIRLTDDKGLPNSVIEAMACRTPVVITPFDGLRDDLGKARQRISACRLQSSLPGLADSAFALRETTGGGDRRKRPGADRSEHEPRSHRCTLRRTRGAPMRLISRPFGSQGHNVLGPLVRDD